MTTLHPRLPSRGLIRLTGACALIACTLAASMPAMAQAQPIPLRNFFKHPQEAYFQLSPDGQMLAWMAPYQGRMNVHVRPIKGGPAVRVTSETARDVAGYSWKGNRILYDKDFGGDENFHLVSVSLDGRDVKDLTPGDKVRAGVLDDLMDDDAHIIVSHNKRDPKVFDVFRTDVRTGAEVLIAQNPGNISRWIFDHSGKLRAAQTTDGVNSTLLYRATEAEDFKPILTTHFKDTVAPLFFTFDNQRLYVASNRCRDRTAIYELDPTTAMEGALVAEHNEVDVTDLHYSRLRKVLTDVSFYTWKEERKFFNQSDEARFNAVQAQLPGYDIQFQASDRLENHFIIAAYNEKTEGKRYLYDVKSNQLSVLAEINPDLPESQMADVKPITYTARDGLTIHGYLTLPKGVAPKSLPVIVNPHGGPWTRDGWGFNAEAQFLANRGYAVLQMNYRGSKGYGRKFWEASFKQWGRAMQDDVTDGVQWLIHEGIADPKRIGIYGGSYGGYATLAGITFTPDLYAAAVDYVGVANLFTFMKTIPPYWLPELEMIHEMVGDPEKDKDLLTAVSPALHADQIKTPLFVAQGANDPRVNKAESDQMVAALRKRGVVVDYMVKDNEGHGFHLEENRFEFYEAMEKFFAKHLKPR